MHMYSLADPNVAEVKLIKSQCSEICGASNIKVIGNVAERRDQLLVCNLRQYSVLNYQNVVKQLKY